MDFFQRPKGLRQGDSFSPYLFVLAMDAFSRLIIKARKGGFVSEFKVEGRGREEAGMTHLLYADDTIMFGKASQEKLLQLN